MVQALSQVISRGHQLIGEVLRPGDLAIDLTAGNGYDTLMLAERVGADGSVLAFDLQPQAIDQTAARLQRAGVRVHRLDEPVVSLPRGVSLVQTSHAELGNWNLVAPRVIIANLGYLPGGDKTLVTRPDSTLAALQTGCEILASGGRIVIVVYTGHPGGQDEAKAVEQFFAELDEREFEVVSVKVANRPRAPFLLVAGKLG